MAFRHLLILPLLLGAPVVSGTGPSPVVIQAPPGMIVVGVAREPVLPLPFLATNTPDADVSDQLFLRLGNLGQSFNPTGDKALTPMLAEKWTRVDSLTLLFTLHPNARWHDGVPVTSRDLVFTWQLAKNPVVNPDQASIEAIAAIEAVDPRTVRVRFRRAFQEQLYLVGFGLQALPAHLLEKIPPDSIATSEFARRPVGNGPYRFERRVAGQQVELRADPAFFRGKPSIARLIFRYVPDAQTRMTLLLAGELDLIDNVLPPQATQVTGHRDYRLVTFPSNVIAYALYNTRSAADTAKPSPILADRRVREALGLALDRENMARAVFGAGTLVPDAVRSQAWSWIGVVPRSQQQLPRAKALLDEAGWKEIGPDGIRRRNGVPLRLKAIYVPTSAVRTAFAVQTQQMWRAAGIDVTIEPVDGGSYGARRFAGDWDIEYGQVNQDPTPMSLTQSWSCASAARPRSSNIARWCDPTFDKLLAAAVASPSPAKAWQAVFDRMASEHPATVLAAPLNQLALHTRYEGVMVWPVKSWLSLWQWRVRPEGALPRDR